jgi:hypothetical protein
MGVTHSVHDGLNEDLIWHDHLEAQTLTTCDDSLWGILKENISQLWLTNIQDLKTAIRDCFYEIQPSKRKKMSERTWTRKKQCEENGGNT